MSTVHGQETQTVPTMDAVQMLVDQVAAVRAEMTDMRNAAAQRDTAANISASFVETNAASLVTPFSGKTGEDITIFLDNLQAAARLGSWSEDLLLEVAKLRLEGDARRVVQYNAHLREATTFAEFKEGLLNNYKNLNSTRHFREQLSMIKQLNKESVTHFADRIKKINVYTYELTSNDVANRVILQEAECRALDAFLRGLTPEMSRRVRASLPKTLAEAVQSAVMFNEIDAATQVPEKRAVFSSTNSCFKCGLSGHIAKNCRQKQCFTCKQFGHIAKQCRKRGTGRKQQLN